MIGSVVDHELAEVMAQVQRSAIQSIISWEASLKESSNPLVMKDYSLLGHLSGVASAVAQLCSLMGMSHASAARLFYAASLHDWGKIGNLMYWLNRSFTDEERILKAKHPRDSLLLMRQSYPSWISPETDREIRKIELLVLFHHHPEILSECLPPEFENVREDMEREVFVLHCADIIQAWTEKRWDREELTHEQVCGQLGCDLDLPRYNNFENLKKIVLGNLVLVSCAAVMAA